VVGSPVLDVPAVDVPAVDAPAVDAPAVEAPAVEAPAVEPPVIVVVAAGTGGIGQAFIEQILRKTPTASVYASYSKTPPAQALLADDRITWSKADLKSETEVSTWLNAVESLDWLVNCAGMLHTEDNGPEKSIKEFNTEFFDQNMQANCLPTLLLAKYAAPLFRKTKNDSTTRIFATVSAKVGSIEDNRLGGWYSYRASKAALNMCLKNLSIEWQRQLPNVCVASLHPGTTDTRLSKPFQKNVSADSLFQSSYTADRLIEILGVLTAEQSGRFWSWDGTELPW